MPVKSHEVLCCRMSFNSLLFQPMSEQMMLSWHDSRGHNHTFLLDCWQPLLKGLAGIELTPAEGILLIQKETALDTYNLHFYAKRNVVVFTLYDHDFVANDAHRYDVEVSPEARRQLLAFLSDIAPEQERLLVERLPIDDPTPQFGL